MAFVVLRQRHARDRRQSVERIVEIGGQLRASSTPVVGALLVAVRTEMDHGYDGPSGPGGAVR
jgi:hypothetical protein